MRSFGIIGRAVLAAGLPLLFVDSAAAIRILMHGREAAATFRDDPFALMHLESVFGADNVDYLQGSLAAADGSSAAGYDVVYISSTMASSDTRGKYEDSTVGIVFGENALAHDNNDGNFFLSDAGTNNDNVMDRQTINIVNPTHPLAAGLSGEVTVLNSPINNYWWQYARGPLAPGVTLIADGVINPPPAPEDPPYHAIIAADVGAQLFGDGLPERPATAAGRRVFFFLSDFGAIDLTDDGKALFNAAFEWAAADPVPALGDYNENGVVDAADYTVWRDNLGDTESLPNDDSAGVGEDDFDRWKMNFGNTSSGSALGAGAVPEPGSVFITALMLFIASAARPIRNA